MRIIARLNLALLAVVWTSLAASAQAQVTEHTDQTAYTAAAPGLTLLDFAAANPGGYVTDYSTAAGLTLDGLNFTGRFTGGT